MRKLLLGHAGLWAFVSLASTATAGGGEPDSVEDKSISGTRLDTVVVTATRTQQLTQNVLEATTVITRQQIENSQLRSVDELLRTVEGISVGNSGGQGKLTSFFVRGTESDHLLVLIDGVKIGSATAGSAALQNLPLDQVERIEFVRGPRSSLYGSEAIGGVLQVFTRRATGAVRTEAAVSGGSFDTRQVSVAVGGAGDNGWFNLRGGLQSTDGIDACRGSSALFAGCFTEEPDRDGYRDRSIALGAGYRFGTDSEVQVNFLRAADRVDYDGSFTNRSRILQQVIGASLVQGFANERALTLRLGRAWDRTRDFLGSSSSASGFITTRRDTASAQFDLPLVTQQVLSLGADYQKDVVDSSTPYDEGSRDNKSVFAQYVGEFGQWRAEASARSDDNQQFGSHQTGSVGLGYKVSDALRFSAQFGTAFRAPNFNELYYPGFSNPALEPERSRSAELAAKGRAAGAEWRVSLFDTRVRDLIGFDSNFLPANVDEARIRGVEAAASVGFYSWNFSAGITALDPENRATGNTLARRPRLAGNIDAEWHIDRLRLGGRMNAQGHSFDNAANTRRVGGFGVLDLRGEYQLTPDFAVQARIANVFDRRYETVAFYNQAGRAGYLTLRWQP